MEKKKLFFFFSTFLFFSFVFSVTQTLMGAMKHNGIKNREIRRSSSSKV